MLVPKVRFVALLPRVCQTLDEVIFLRPSSEEDKTRRRQDKSGVFVLLRRTAEKILAATPIT